MQKLFNEVTSLDKRCYEEFALNEDILMEHAASGINRFIRANFDKGSVIVVACGSGNNGADGLALARLLYGDFIVKIFYVIQPKSPMAILQFKRAHSIGVRVTVHLNECDILVDALYGTGFRGDLDCESRSVLQTINKLKAYKIACDIPSGIKENGECDTDTFNADITLTMGALKKSMFSDNAKDYVGKIRVIDLGISRSLYERESSWNLLDFSDMKLPFRNKQNTHKGSFGHLAILNGDKSGASIMSALSALKFGAGLVTMISKQNLPHLHYSIMRTQNLPTNATAIALGMGLGLTYNHDELDIYLDNSLPLIADADIFHSIYILKILKRKNLILTPHPKEFVSLLKRINLADISVTELQKNRFLYTEKFCSLYPDITFLLKGANVLIGQKDTFYVNAYGTSALAKAGSGDVLSGLIAALLAQGYSPLDSAINASLSHTKLVQNYEGADFSLTPDDLIKGIGNL